MNKPAPEANNKKTAPAILRDLWLGSCARFTVLCLILLTVSSIGSDSLTLTYIDTVRYFLLLPFAVCLTLAAWARRSDKLSGGVKCVLHPLAVLGGFYLCCYLPYQLRTNPTNMQVFIILLAVALLYALGMGIYALVTRKSRQKRIDDTPYVSQFGKK